jgi:hypothetical protein
MKQITEATRLAPYALSDVAVDVIGDVSTNAVTMLAGREDQVGFDLPQFIQNIRDPSPLVVTGAAHGSVSILDQEQMGTVDDFDAISNDPQLWHAGTGRGDLFRLDVFEDPEEKAFLESARKSVWGTKTPQWYLMEYGYTGQGAYPPVPASHFIASATRGDRIALKLRNAMVKLFNGIPRR